MRKKNIFSKIIDYIEQVLPMSFGNFLMFLVVIYIFVVVGKSIWSNYKSNQELVSQELEIERLESGVRDLGYSINYYQTKSYKEKEARKHLGYIAPGEKVISLPVDQAEDKLIDEGLEEVKIKIPNYTKWWQYFFD